MSGKPDPLARIGFISIRETKQRRIGDFALDPEILLPVELPSNAPAAPRDVKWEAIVAGALKVLAYEPATANADYYRKFILAVKPDIMNELTHLGITSARNGDYDLGIEVFRSLEGMFPEDASPPLNLAIIHDQSARHFEKLERPDSMEEHANLAFEAYKRALAIDPSEPAIHYNFAFFYLHQRSFEKAREHLEFYAKSGTDRTLVREAARLIKEIDSQGLMDGLFKKAYDFIRIGKEDEGIECAREFLKSHPEVSNAWFLLGWGLRRTARYEEGREAFQKALSLGAPHPDLLNELAICLMETGDLKESRKKLNQALEMEPENTKIISNLGIVAMKQGNDDEAEGFFRIVLELDPEDLIAPKYLDVILKKKTT
jgi:Flp pilus assembly protein TadD